MLDLSAAFDTIDHQVLLNRLNCAYGLTDKALMWAKSYLSEHYQMVLVKGKQSKLMLLDYGLPQDSVLGSKKYNMYTGPSDNIIQQHKINHKSYADDSNLYISFKAKDEFAKQNSH